MSAADDVIRLLANGGPLLLDFDGPICSIFAGYPAPDIAGELVTLIRQKTKTLPEHLANEADPLEVLRWAGQSNTPGLTTCVEDALCAAELHAAATAEPTPYGREVIVAARQLGLAVAVVSNNSRAAVVAYLTAHRLAEHVSPIVGRAYADPARMKPNPEPILDAVRALRVEPDRCVLIGDSLADIEGARAAGMPVIGYANAPGKASRFHNAGADLVVTSMGDVAKALLALNVQCQQTTSQPRF